VNLGLGTVSDIVIATATVIYTVGSFMLWWTTKRNTDLLAVQVAELRGQAERNASFNRVLIDNSIVDAHREVWGLVLNNPRLFQLLSAKEDPSADTAVIAEWLGSIFINHCARVHLAHHENIYNPSDIDAFARDARSLFSYALVRWRWKSVQKYHSREFREFVDRMIQT